jgi:cytochrome c-type biogenesis protein CcmE
VSGRSPARLVIALSVAAVLTVFLLYTAVAGSSTPQLTPSQLAGHAGKVSAVGQVVGPLHGDSHSTGGLRFGLKNIQGRSGVVPVVYHGENPPPLFAVGRHVVVNGTFAGGHLIGNGILTKCPSKYEAAKPSA